MDLALLDSLTAPEWMFQPPEDLRAILPPWSLELHYQLQQRYRERVDAMRGRSLRQLAAAGNYDAQQLYAHRVYWASLDPRRVRSPATLVDALVSAEAKRVRGSGWVWIAQTRHDQTGYAVAAVQLSSAPPYGEQPALAIDLWEHAWYPHWGVDREQYVRQMLRHLRWDLLVDPRYA